MNYIIDILWIGVILLMLIISIYFSFKLKFAQFNFKQMFKNVIKNDGTSTVSPFASLMLTLAGRIGVGSISGVALALYIGGSGAIFWLWIMAFIGAINTFAETVLASKYNEKDGDAYVGGPSYYIEKGLNNRKLGVVYSFLIIICYVCLFLGIQSNTITKSLVSLNIFNNSSFLPILTGIILSVMTGAIIFGGIKRITNFVNKFVPIMGIFYMVLAFYVIINNFSLIPGIFSNIMENAFSLKAGLGGLIGTVILIGVKRSIFSSEAGIGTGAIASSVTKQSKNASLGYVQMLGIYITSLIICTATALIILIGPSFSNILDPNGIEFALSAFNYHFGSTGQICLFLCVSMFSFSTILTGYYYGDASFRHIFKNSRFRFIMKFVTIIVVFLGCVLSSTFLWSLVDLFVSFLAFINLYAIFRLRDDVYEEYRKYKE